LTSIDVSKNISLSYLNCAGNRLANLDVTKNTALDILECYQNVLTSLDVTQNTAVSYLQCGANKLTSLNITKNTNMYALDCYENKLTALDVSKNLNLNWLRAYDNKLAHLDISKNLSLSYLDSSTNLLQSLNVKNGNNANFSTFNAVDNPNLKCIQVDNVAYSTANWIYKDGMANYNTNCNYTLDVKKTTKKEITMYPIPVKNILNFSEEVSELKITDMLGRTVKYIPDFSKTINVEHLPEGNYIIVFKTKTGIVISQKLIKS